MRISDWSSDVCSSDLTRATPAARTGNRPRRGVSVFALRSPYHGHESRDRRRRLAAAGRFEARFCLALRPRKSLDGMRMTGYRPYPVPDGSFAGQTILLTDGDDPVSRGLAAAFADRKSVV